MCGLETPPRTWRRLTHKRLLFGCLGNTSTDVEKTPLLFGVAGIF